MDLSVFLAAHAVLYSDETRVRSAIAMSTIRTTPFSPAPRTGAHPTPGIRMLLHVHGRLYLNNSIVFSRVGPL